VSHALSSPATAVRWRARALSVLILLFWGFFLIAHLAGDEGVPSRPLTWADYLTLSALITSLAGLALAWKWERAGAAVTLAAVAACAAVNWKVLLFPGALIPVAAALHLLSWRAHRTPHQGDAARVR
jgi:cytochrome bd-type quinol oxidase subunit 2